MEHEILAHAIDRFHEAKGGGIWELRGLDQLARADGFVHDKEELEAGGTANAPTGDGPPDTTLTTLVMLKMLVEKSQKQGLMERKDEKAEGEEQDEDRQMHETRGRLAHMSLDEGEYVDLNVQMG